MHERILRTVRELLISCAENPKGPAHVHSLLRVGQPASDFNAGLEPAAASIAQEGIHQLRRTRERPCRGNMKCNGMLPFWISTHAGESKSCRRPALSSCWY